MAFPAVPLSHPPTLADIDALPPNMKGEIIDGVFYAMTRPRAFHQQIGALVLSDLVNPFHRGRGGPGGWLILPEPGIELPRSPEISPDVAGWHRERLPQAPRNAPITLVPDWICEVLSSSTRRYDQYTKRPYYASIGVSHLWIVDHDALLVTASALENGRWVELGVWSEETEARIPPFDAVPLNVNDWWLGATDAPTE